MKNLYTGLKARITAQDTASVIKYIGKWDNQLQRMKDGEELGFRHPAVFFEFVSPQEVLSVGGGVQVFDPLLVKVHVLHEFYNDKDTGSRINLDVYDVGKLVHGWLQGHYVTGADYGSSPLNRTQVEEDDTHGNVFHYMTVYTCTWTDNSTTYPRDGYEIDPILDATITSEILEADTPAITLNKSSIDFGQVALGESATSTFTVAGEHLDEEPADDNPLLITSSNGVFLLSFATIFKTRLTISPTDGEVDETTVTVKYTPTTGGGDSGVIRCAVPGISEEIALTGAGIANLLKEDGDALLLESGDNILL